MADSCKTGKFLLSFHAFLLLFPSSSPISRVFVASDSVSVDEDEESANHHDAPALDRYQAQLERLDELVSNLGEIVSKLESRLSDFDPMAAAGLPPVDQRPRDGGEGIQEGERDDGWAPHRESEASSVDIRATGGPVSVTKFRPFWTERFRLMSAVRLDSSATCIDVLPFTDLEGQRKYVAVGDEWGKVFVLHRSGDLALEFQTAAGSAVSAMLSYLSVYKNESVLITGHVNGRILMHRVWEHSNGEEWSSLQMETAVAGEGEDSSSQITILEVHHVGRIRYILSANAVGKIMVFRENGSMYGSVTPVRRPLAFLKQRLLFLTEDGAGSLDLRTMKTRESECEGMNHSIARAYVFDAAERSKAYGLTYEGDLIHVLLLGDTVNFKCRVRSRRKVEMGEPLVLHAIRGYLFFLNPEKISIYNVSSQHYVRTGAPRFLFSTDLDGIRSSFLDHVTDGDTQRTRAAAPLIAGDQEKLVVLSLGYGYIGTYHSKLPLFKSEYGTILWSSPVLFFILFLLVAWQFLARKKEALTSWGPDDPFGSPASMGPGSVDRSFAESSSRNADVVDLGGGGRGAGRRRYGSPSGYSGGAASFRPGSDDHKLRLAPADPNLRTSPELKYRGSNLESAGFQKRRENLFANSQAVDDDN